MRLNTFMLTRSSKRFSNHPAKAGHDGSLRLARPATPPRPPTYLGGLGLECYRPVSPERN
jgi:hypothetical protein